MNVRNFKHIFYFTILCILAWLCTLYVCSCLPGLFWTFGPQFFNKVSIYLSIYLTRKNAISAIPVSQTTPKLLYTITREKDSHPSKPAENLATALSKAATNTLAASSCTCSFRTYTYITFPALYIILATGAGLPPPIGRFAALDCAFAFVSMRVLCVHLHNYLSFSLSVIFYRARPLFLYLPLPRTREVCYFAFLYIYTHLFIPRLSIFFLVCSRIAQLSFLSTLRPSGYMSNSTRNYP